MSRRKQSDYEVVLGALLDLLPAAPKVEEVMVDFERAMWKAFESKLPDVSVRGCGFHWAQAVYRKVIYMFMSFFP